MSMIQAIKLLADGIEQENWEKVVAGYNLLTGESLVAKTTFSRHADFGWEEMQKLIDSISKGVYNYVYDFYTEKREKTGYRPLSEIEAKEKPKKKPGRPKKNKVVEESQESQDSQESQTVNGLFGESDEALKKESLELSKKVGAKSYRPKYEPVEVICALCHKKDKVHPTLVPKKLGSDDDEPRYICNKCNGGRR